MAGCVFYGVIGVLWSHMVVVDHHLHSGFRGASFLIDIRLDTFSKL